MKKFKLIAFAVMAIIGLTLTSCEDESIAYNLEGTWKGDMYMVRDNHRASYSEIEFIGDPFRTKSGTGFWYDEYSSRPGDYFCSRIDWKVKNGRIYIWLLDDGDFEIQIFDYTLDGDRFYGYIDYAGGSKEFRLYRTYNPHWSDYDYGYGYYDDDYYWAKGSRSSDDSIKVPMKPHTHEMRMD